MSDLNRWVSADECAAHLGMVKRGTSTPNRRLFLESVACRPDFPPKNRATRTWWLPDVQEWAERSGPFRGVSWFGVLPKTRASVAFRGDSCRNVPIREL